MGGVEVGRLFEFDWEEEGVGFEGEGQHLFEVGR